MLSPWMGLNDEKTGPGNLQMGARTFTSITCIHPPYTRPAGWDTAFGCPDFELGVPYCAEVCQANGPDYANMYTTPLSPALKVRFQTGARAARAACGQGDMHIGCSGSRSGLEQSFSKQSFSKRV